MFKRIIVGLLALRNTPLCKPEALNLIKTAYHLSKSCTVRPLSRLELQIYVPMSLIVCTNLQINFQQQQQQQQLNNHQWQHEHFSLIQDLVLVQFLLFTIIVENKTKTRHYQSVHLGVIVSRLREDFLCQARVSAAKMGEKEDAKLKWTLLSMQFARIFPRNSQRKLPHRIANAHDYREMLWTESNLSISSGKRTRDWAAKPWGAEGTKSSHILPPHPTPASPFVYHSQVTSLDIP